MDSSNLRVQEGTMNPCWGSVIRWDCRGRTALVGVSACLADPECLGRRCPPPAASGPATSLLALVVVRLYWLPVW